MKHILWDFDGVIMNSEEIRIKGFVYALRNYAEDDINRFLQYHKINGGLSRYNKFQYFFDTILGVEAVSDEIGQLCKDYTEIMLKDLNDKDLLIKDSIDFIVKNANVKDMILVSASDETELHHLCEKLEINHHFSMILGSPTPKNKNLSNLIRTKRINPEKSIYIGDSINDKEASEENSIKFFGYNNPKLKETGTNYINTFLDFKF